MTTKEERKALMESNPPEITGIHSTGFYFDWRWKGFDSGSSQ